MKDPIRLERLNELTDGEPDSIRMVLYFFVSDFETILETIKEAFLASDDQVLQRSAHSLKGALANIGADRMVDIAWDMEESAKNHEREQYQKQLAELNKEYKLVCGFLAEQAGVSR